MQRDRAGLGVLKQKTSIVLQGGPLTAPFKTGTPKAQDSSHHQDYYLHLLVGNPYKPSLQTGILCWEVDRSWSQLNNTRQTNRTNPAGFRTQRALQFL